MTSPPIPAARAIVLFAQISVADDGDEELLKEGAYMSATDFSRRTIDNSQSVTEEFAAYSIRNRSECLRLLQEMANRPGKVHDNGFLFGTPILISVDADSMRVDAPTPKRKRKPGKGLCITFEITSRDLDLEWAHARALATFIGCMFLRDLVRDYNKMERLGVDMTDVLHLGLLEFMDYIGSATARLYEDRRAATTTH